MKTITERFLDYVAIDTQSTFESSTIPSAEKERNLADFLVEELKKLGSEDACVSQNACVYATIPAVPKDSTAPVIGFCAHLDTTPEFSGTDVKARIVEHYDGGDIVLNSQQNIVMKTSEFPHLKNYVGQDLIVTDGTTLLGADDKAGIAEIMDMIQYFHENPQISHGEIQVFFPCDEEIGCNGAKALDKSRFSPDFAYTLDGGALGEITYECFNAASAEISIKGINIHPGLSKNQMVNSILIGNELINMLPAAETPGHTENYEGYYHVLDFVGGVELTKLKLYIRDHDKEKFRQRKDKVRDICEYLNRSYGQGTVEWDITDTYSNMSDWIAPRFEIVEAVQNAMKSLGISPYFIPMRGGTDGAVLSFMGIPCPNICTGGHNFHGRYEYIPVQSMEKTSAVLVEIVKGFAKA